MATYTYPGPPAGVPDSVIRPSAQFKLEVRKVITALIGFGQLYLLVLLASIIIAICCGLIGWAMISAVRHWLAIALGVGLLGIGIMVTFFVIKFLFAKRKTDQSGYTEILEAEYPDLFGFIRRISEETGTVFPKHIYLSSEVNAAVFYDSSFWSMIFPVRKNLVIGLGLINMTNLSEFKAVIAHEFGHFSQKSMRAGSYVYHANKVIYNMLYENTSYEAALQRWGNIHFTFALCARITVAIVKAIQWVLRQAYKTVNRQYMSLSRQMEFHADAVAAKAAGSNNAIHALRRIEFADSCYDSVIAQYNEWIPANLKGGNLYSQQRIAATFIAGEYGFPFVAGLPVLHEADQHYRNFSRISIEDQWASHPTRQQREESMSQLGIEGEVIEESAWVLFPDAETLQERITNGLYETVTFSAEPALIFDEQFAAKYAEARRQYSYPAVYDGFYNRRTISVFDPEAAASDSPAIDDIGAFFNSHKDSFARLEAARSDLQMLEQIADKESGIRSFDFDGNRYSRSDAELVKATLEAEIRRMEEGLTFHDQAAYRYFLERAGTDSNGPAELKNGYRAYFELQTLAADNFICCNHMMELIRPFFEQQTIETARTMDKELKEATELFKSRLEKVAAILELNALTTTCTLPESLKECRNKRWSFMDASDQFIGEELDALTSHVQEFGNWTFEMSFHAQKELLLVQSAIMSVPEMVLES